MNAKDKPDFTLAITALCETLGREASEATLYGYWVALMDLSLTKVQRAVARALKTSKFMPSPAELRELAGEASADDRALLAWSAVEKASAIGAYKSVDFADPLINAAIRTLGGWPAILDKPVSEFDTFIRKDFLKAYASLARSDVTGDVCKPLPGLGNVAVSGVVKIGLKGTVNGIERIAEREVPRISAKLNVAE